MNDEFFEPTPEQNLENRFAPYIALRAAMNARGIACHTYDVYVARGEVPDAVLFHDVPRKPLGAILGKNEDKIRKFLWQHEAELITRRNWDPARLAAFEKIFTWRKSQCSDPRYLWINFSRDIDRTVWTGLDRRKLCVIIAGNHQNSGKGELYSKRLDAIRWFEKHHPDDLDFYGMGWQLFNFWKPRFLRHLNRIPMLKPLRRWLAPQHPSYHGPVGDKIEAMKDYKFAICFENASNENWYVTEKPFDCFFAGCIPVYWGAPNITDLIPPDCFIDMRKFAGFEALYDFLTAMTDDERTGYISRIAAFLKSEQAKPYSAQWFGETIAEGIYGLA